MCDMPLTLHPPITQRHLEAEVAHCVGGVISPLLFNVALHGMEKAAGVRYQKLAAGDTKLARDSPALIRFADDCAPRALKGVPM